MYGYQDLYSFQDTARRMADWRALLPQPLPGYRTADATDGGGQAGGFSSTSMMAKSNGERIQNCQNEDKALDVTYTCAYLREKEEETPKPKAKPKPKYQLSIVWELKPIEPPRRYLSMNQLPRIPLRLAVIIDVSHSMEEPYGPDDTMSKLDKVKLFAQLLAVTMDEDDCLGIISFGTKAQTVFPMTKMNKEAKEKAVALIEAMTVGGVTNMGAGLMAAVELFRNIYSQRRSLLEDPMPCRTFNDNLVLFTDGMANEGMTETDEVMRELNKAVEALRVESHFDKDYHIKLAALGTGGFLPELLFNLGMNYSSDAFYFLEENTNLELNMMKPVMLRQTSLVSNMQVEIEALNGVTLDKKLMTQEYIPYDPDVEEQPDDTKIKYYIHDIASDLSRHLVCYLKLPNKHKKLLKNKEVLQVKIKYRDLKNEVRTFDKTLSYDEIPKKPEDNCEKDIIVNAQHETRLMAQRVLDNTAKYMKKLNRTRCREILESGGDAIRSYCDHIGSMLPEECQEYLMNWNEPILANFDFCAQFIADMSVRWDDAWARLKAMSSSLGREVPTASGVFMDGAEMYTPMKVDEKMESLCSRLKDMYNSKGLCTDTIDHYKTVIKELKEKLDRLDQEGVDFKETRI